MRIPTYARYDYVIRKACEFLEQFEINSFPIDPISIIKKQKWGIVEYSELMIDFNCSLDRVIKCLGSKDGYTILDEYNYTISYNNVDKPKDRILFTIMHEIGHIYLNHLKDFEKTRLSRGGLNEDENKVLENEANAFARNVLAPVSIVQHLKIKSPSNLSYRFGISPDAARARLDFLDIDIKYYKENGFFNRIFNIFLKFYYKKRCTNCGYGTIKKDINYCPICGEGSLKWGDGNMIYDKEVELDEEGRVSVCPVCENEQINKNGNYCHICGTYIINKCTHYDDDEYTFCNEIASSNARYCIKCGSETTFFKQGLLADYKQEQEAKKAADIFMTLPDGIDEELPFN